MKKHLIIFINVVFMMSGAVLFMLGIIAASETLFGSKINEMILEKLHIIWIKRIYWRVFLSFLAIFIITYMLQKINIYL